MSRKTTSNAIPSRSLLLLAAWFGLSTGLLLLASRLVARHVLDRVIDLHVDHVWTVPLANTAVMVAAAGLLLGAGLIHDRLRSRGLASGVFATLSIYSVLLLYPRLNSLALLLLSAGLGVQTGRMIAARHAGFERFVRRSLVLYIVVIPTAVLALNGVAGMREGRAYQRLGTAPVQAPNVVFVIWDTVRAASLELYGYSRRTAPGLDSLAAGGIVFDRAIATTSWTLPSHASFFTGRYPFDLSTGWRAPLDDRHPTVAELLRDAGYATAAFFANRNFGSPAWGLGRGFAHYEADPLDLITVLDNAPIVRRLIRQYNRQFGAYIVPGHWRAGGVNRGFLDWLAGRTDRPFFAFLNYFDAHEPYAPPPPFDRLFGDPRHRRIRSDHRPTDPEIRDLRDAYDGAIAYLDTQLRELVEELERRDLLRNTIVIVSSDHGEHFGEHGLLDHGNSLYIETLHVPLVIFGPTGAPAGTRITEAVTLRDLPATILDLAGVPPPDGLPGRSLARFWTGAAAPDAETEPLLAELSFARNQPEWYPLARGDMRSVVVWPYHYILNGDAAEELYDLVVDPAESRNLAASDTLALERLRRTLAQFPDRVTAAR